MNNKLDSILDRSKTNSIKWNPGLVQKWCGYSDDNLLSFWVADMDFPCPEPITAALHRVADQRIYGYSDMTSSYYDSIISWYERRFKCHLEKEWICYSNGIVPAINYILQGLCSKGDKVIIQPPVYYPFRQAIENNGFVVSENCLINDGGHYLMDFDNLEMLASDPAAKIMILCSPHNPVGRVWTRKELYRVLEICKKHGVILVSDEIHCDIVYKPHIHTPVLQFGEFADNVILCSSPSKTFNIAGLQMSNIIIPNRELRERFNNVTARIGLLLPNIFGIAAVEAAYTECDRWLENTILYLQNNVETIKNILSANLPGNAELTNPEGTFLAWIDFKDADNYLTRADVILNKANVALDNGYMFGKGGESFERINFACPNQILREGLNRIVSQIKMMHY